MNIYKIIDKMPNFKLIFLLSFILFEPRREKIDIFIGQTDLANQVQR